MDLVLSLRIVVGIVASIFLVYMGRDIWKHRHELEKGHTLLYSFIGLYVGAADALGIGSVATSMASYKLTKTVPDRHLASTCNVAFALTTIASFVMFLSVIEVDSVTLISMIASATLGSLVGASLMAKWPIQVVRRVLGTALLIVAVIMACRTLNLGPFGTTGTATGLSGYKLAIAIVGNFFLGAFQTMGIGLYGPCMALVSMLGMNVATAFPIMMGSCSFVMPFCSLKFIKEGMYNRKASLIATITGTIGAIFTYVFVKTIALTTLIWIVVAVQIYTALIFFKDNKKNGDDTVTEAVCKCGEESEAKENIDGREATSSV